jgi:hypothetical protein
MQCSTANQDEEQTKERGCEERVRGSRTNLIEIPEAASCSAVEENERYVKVGREITAGVQVHTANGEGTRSLVWLVVFGSEYVDFTGSHGPRATGLAPTASGERTWSLLWLLGGFKGVSVAHSMLWEIGYMPYCTHALCKTKGRVLHTVRRAHSP